MPSWAQTTCEHCGAALGQALKGRPRRFCSVACKQAAYRGRVTKVTRTGYTLSEGQIIHGAGATSSPASAGQPGKAVEL
mgnify:CR=1 FL=1